MQQGVCNVFISCEVVSNTIADIRAIKYVYNSINSSQQDVLFLCLKTLNEFFNLKSVWKQWKDIYWKYCKVHYNELFNL